MSESVRDTPNIPSTRNLALWPISEPSSSVPGFATAIETGLKDGFVVSRDNIFTASDEPDLSGKGSLTSVPYAYTVDAAANVPAIVAASAGVGKITV